MRKSSKVLSEAAREIFNAAVEFDLSRSEFAMIALLILAYYPSDENQMTPTVDAIKHQTKTLSNSRRIEALFGMLGNPVECAATANLIFEANRACAPPTTPD